MEARSRAGLLKGMYVGAVASVAALALAVAPAYASAASPVLEFVPTGSSFPVPFEAEGGEVTAALAGFAPTVHCSESEGEGEITGPRSTVSNYIFTGCEAQEPGGLEDGRPCESDSANPEEIRSKMIEADLVYIDQAKHEVAMLLNPDEGVYMEFKCGGQTVKASGSFLSPVDPINKVAPSFTAILRSAGASQFPSEYENTNGEKRQAIPTGQKNSDPLATTGVNLTFTIQPSVPLEIKAINVAELEAKKREEEATAKKRQEEEAAAKKRQEDEAAAALAAKQRQAAAEESARKRHLTNARKQCKKVKAGPKRARCVKRANKKYGARQS